MRSEESISTPASRDAEIIYNREEFRILLEQFITDATTLEAPLSLFLLQPVNGQEEQTEQVRLSRVITEQTESNNLRGSLGDATYGIAIPGKDTVDALQTVAKIFNNSPVPIVVGHSIFSIREDKADHMIDLYGAAESALSLAKQRGIPQIVTLLRQGQELAGQDLPNNIKGITTLIHK